jgi:hypothetical protein
MAVWAAPSEGMGDEIQRLGEIEQTGSPRSVGWVCGDDGVDHWLRFRIVACKPEFVDDNHDNDIVIDVFSHPIRDRGSVSRQDRDGE